MDKRLADRTRPGTGLGRGSAAQETADAQRITAIHGPEGRAAARRDKREMTAIEREERAAAEGKLSLVKPGV
jgi:hypothetical protein